MYYYVLVLNLLVLELYGATKGKKLNFSFAKLLIFTCYRKIYVQFCCNQTIKNYTNCLSNFRLKGYFNITSFTQNFSTLFVYQFLNVLLVIVKMVIIIFDEGESIDMDQSSITEFLTDFGTQEIFKDRYQYLFQMKNKHISNRLMSVGDILQAYIKCCVFL